MSTLSKNLLASVRAESSAPLRTGSLVDYYGKGPFFPIGGPGHIVQYTIGINMVNSFKVCRSAEVIPRDELEKTDTDDSTASPLLKNAVRSIVEEIFGEFRPYIIEAKRHLHDKNFDLAIIALQELEYNMFEI